MASPVVVVTSARLDPQESVPLVLLVKKDNQAFLEALGPQVFQVQRVKQERLSHFLAPLELQASRDPLGSKGRKVTEASQEPQDGQASREKRVLRVSQGLDFPGPLAPKVWTACPETWARLGVRAALDLMAYPATQDHKAKRENLALGYQDSKASPAFQAFLAHLERRAASGDQAFLESMDWLAPRDSRGSEVTRDLPEFKALQVHQGFQE